MISDILQAVFMRGSIQAVGGYRGNNERRGNKYSEKECERKKKEKKGRGMCWKG